MTSKHSIDHDSLPANPTGGTGGSDGHFERGKSIEAKIGSFKLGWSSTMGAWEYDTC